MHNTFEEWKPIDGYEQYYEVSNLGRVRSLPRKRIVFKKETIRQGRILSPIKHHKNGYYNVMVSVDKRIKLLSLHRVVATAFIPNLNNLPEVNHKNGNKGDNWVENLEWNSRIENVRHANKTGLIRYAKGEKKPKAIFTNEQVRFIKKEMNKLSIAETISLLGMNPKELRLMQTVCKIRRGKKYKNVV